MYKWLDFNTVTNCFYCNFSTAIWVKRVQCPNSRVATQWTKHATT